jgi:tripartite-type tricarboxylate transporter receptor subunit TctC
MLLRASAGDAATEPARTPAGFYKDRFKAREVLVSLLRLSVAALGAAVLFAAVAAKADDWPTRPIRVISPFAAGSASDTVSRVVLDRVSQLLGQPMVIEAKPGAGGIVGFADVAKADPDGYTLVTSSTSLGTGMVLHRSLPYDPAKDFVGIAMLGVQPNCWSLPRRAGSKPSPIWSPRPRRNRAR